jgi:hypothetical protein
VPFRICCPARPGRPISSASAHDSASMWVNHRHRHREAWRGALFRINPADHPVRGRPKAVHAATSTGIVAACSSTAIGR